MSRGADPEAAIHPAVASASAPRAAARRGFLPGGATVTTAGAGTSPPPDRSMGAMNRYPFAEQSRRIAAFRSGVPQSKPDLVHCLVQAVLEIDEGVFRPELAAELLPAHQAVSVLEKPSEDDERLSLELHPRPLPPELLLRHVELEGLNERQRPDSSDRSCPLLDGTKDSSVDLGVLTALIQPFARRPLAERLLIPRVWPWAAPSGKVRPMTEETMTTSLGVLLPEAPRRDALLDRLRARDDSAYEELVRTHTAGFSQSRGAFSGAPRTRETQSRRRSSRPFSRWIGSARRPTSPPGFPGSR